MSQAAIKVEGLGKRYRLGRRQQYKALRDVLSGVLSKPARAASSLLRRESPSTNGQGGDDILWALKDVSFEVNYGDVVGVIGRNGAGKSTLLKILSRITEPTVGRALIRGRVGSLLEVGTGFHPELTGRENVFLNGAIIGMRRGEIRRKFDEIVAFAELEEFIDTPVKHYSSGMYVRLAFSVAAYLEPEILLVDEVLAVGDAAFQKKCLGKMGDVSLSGRTIFFVSHNMTAIESLCSRVLWLDHGQIASEGPAADQVKHYLSVTAHSNAVLEQVWDSIENAPGNEYVRIRRIAALADDDVDTSIINMATPIVLEFEFWNLQAGSRVNMNFKLMTENGVVAFADSPTREPWTYKALPKGLYRSRCHIPANLLNAGTHVVDLRVVRNDRFIHIEESALVFQVSDAGEDGRSYFGKRIGAVRPSLDWETQPVERTDI